MDDGNGNDTAGKRHHGPDRQIDPCRNDNDGLTDRQNPHDGALLKDIQEIVDRKELAIRDCHINDQND